MRKHLAVCCKGAGLFVFITWGLVALIWEALVLYDWWGPDALIGAFLLGPGTVVAFPFLVWWKSGVFPWLWILLSYGGWPVVIPLWGLGEWMEKTSSHSQ